MKHNFLAAKSMLLLLIVSLGGRISAQTIDLPLVVGGGSTPIVQHLQLGTTVSFRIRPTGGPTGTVNFEVTSGVSRITASGTTSLGAAGLTSYTDGTTTINVTDGGAATAGISISTAAGTTEKEISFNISAFDQSVPVKSRTATVKLVFRNPMKLVFVVDRSGSMECVPNEPEGGVIGWPACEAGVPIPQKWGLAQDALQRFSAAMTTSLNTVFFPSLDQVSVSYFDGVISTASTFPTTFVSVNDFANGIVADFNAQYSTGDLGRNGTNIGAGMVDANTKIGALSNSFREVIVLITDGAQNNALAEQIHTNGRQLNNGTSLNNNESAASFIQVYTLGFDADASGTTYGALLSAICTHSDNFFYTNTSGTYGPAFDELFSRVFNKFSPQIVQVSRKTLVNGSFSETIPVNNGGASLMFSVSFDNDWASYYAFDLEKDGQAVTVPIQRTIGNYSALLSINLMEHPELNTGGIWKVICSPRPIADRHERIIAAQSRDVRASIVCTIDEPALEATYELGKQEFHVGDAVNPSVKLSINGAAVRNAVVTAELVKPGDDKGDLVAKASVPHKVTPGSEINNTFSVKYANIMGSNPGYLAALAPVSNKITLQEKSPGNYSSEFPQKLDVSDNCHVIFRVSFKDSLLGTVERHQRQNIFVRFGDLDIDLLGKKSKATKGEAGFRYYDLTVTPAYRVKDKIRRVGPGYGQSFALGKNREAIRDVVDNGDGSYTFTVNNKQSNKLYLLDEKLYDGPFAFFGIPYTKYKWNVSAHIGGTAPLGSLDTLYDNGAAFEIDFGRRILPFLSVDLHGGYYGFKGGFNTIGATAYLTGYFQPNAEWSIGASGGGGFYFPKDRDAEFGYSYRFLIERNQSQRISVGAELGRIVGAQSDLDFLVFGLSLKYRF